jgi:formate--tetrahydrofolate ligase
MPVLTFGTVVIVHRYSFTANPKKTGAPTGHIIPVRSVRLAAGAEFVVVLTGDVMTMPGTQLEYL